MRIVILCFLLFIYISKLKKNITKQLTDQYGDNVCIEFMCDNNLMNAGSEASYTMKIKKVTNEIPKPDNYKISELCVNPKNKK